MWAFDEEDEGGGRRRVVRWLGVVIALVAAGWFIGRPALTDSESRSSAPPVPVVATEPSTSPPTSAPVTTPAPSVTVTTTTTTTTPTTDAPPTTERPATTPPPDTTDPPTTTESPTTTTPATTAPPETTTPPTTAPPDTTTPPTTAPPETTTPPTTAPPDTTTPAETTEPSTTSTVGPTTTVPPPTPTTTTTPEFARPGAELPDGRAVGVTATFTDTLVVLRGAVVDEEARRRVVDFATAYRVGDATVLDELVVDDAAPPDAGVYVLEYTGPRFDLEDPVVDAPMAAQLARLVARLQADPATTAHVIGNVEDTGDSTLSYALSQRQAMVVVEHLVAEGVDRTRLTTQPGGDTFPVSAAATEAGQAINRRVDVVVFGLLG